MDEEYDEKTMPNEFLCPISQEIMKDPVLTIDGFCFDRRQIQEWFNKGKKTNPLTGKELPSTTLIENRSLRNVIEHHNIRLREIERQAAVNAEKTIQNHNQRFASIYPELVNHCGMLDLDKFGALSNQTTNLKNLMRSVRDKFADLKKCCEKDTKNCAECKNYVTLLSKYKAFLEKQVEENLKLGSVVEQRTIMPETVHYLMMNADVIRGIDFRRTKKDDLKIHEMKGILITVLTVEELVARIRKAMKIPEKDFVRVWVTSYKTLQLYNHITEQVETITGTYLCKVRCVGKKVENWKKKIKQLDMNASNYLIIEHGPAEQFVFRDENAKCDYCYKVKKIQAHCDCKKVFYCSADCRGKDKNYHDSVCKLIHGSSQNIMLKN